MKPELIKAGAIVLAIGSFVAAHFLDGEASVALGGLGIFLVGYVMRAPGDVPGPTPNISGGDK